MMALYSYSIIAMYLFNSVVCLSRGTRPLAGLNSLVFVVARVRNSEVRK